MDIKSHRLGLKALLLLLWTLNLIEAAPSVETFDVEVLLLILLRDNSIYPPNLSHHLAFAPNFQVCSKIPLFRQVTLQKCPCHPVKGV